MAKKYCYLFKEGNATMRELLGGKGANQLSHTAVSFLEVVNVLLTHFVLTS